VSDAQAVPLVYGAISDVTLALTAEGIGKTRRNQDQKYNFRGIDDIYNAIAPVLAKHRLNMLPRVLARTCEQRETKSGGKMYSVTVEVEFDLVCAVDGSRHVVRAFGEAMDTADKATNKAMSAAYKYAAVQTFCIPTEGDNDADGDSHGGGDLTEAEAHQRWLDGVVEGVRAAVKSQNREQVAQLRDIAKQRCAARDDRDGYQRVIDAMKEGAPA